MRNETVQYYAELLGKIQISKEYPVVNPTSDWEGQFPNGHLSDVTEMGAAVKTTIKRVEV